MAWTTDWVEMLRYRIGDFASPQTYSNSDLLSTLAIAASIVVQEIYLSTQYTVDVDGESIVPDPSGDNDFAVLTVLKAACMLDTANLIAKARISGISLKIGPSNVSADGVNSAKTIKDLSACAEFDAAKAAYGFGNSLAGRLIIGPANGPDIPTPVHSYPI